VGWKRWNARWTTVATVAAVVGVSAALVAPMGAGGATIERPTAPAGFVDAGTLHLELGATDRFFVEGTGLTQAITESRCEIAQPAAPPLVALTAGTHEPGIFGDAIGVFSSGSRGTPCSRVSVGEQPLRLALAGQLAGQVILRADLDIEVKSNAQIEATLLRGTAVVGTWTLRSGTFAQGDTTVGSNPFDCSARSDSGPDAGAADNCLWVVGSSATPFDAIELRALTGEFSLEGGADDASLEDSLFHLAQLAPTGTVNCPGDPGTTDLVPQTGSNFSITGSRGEDADKTSGCTPIDYRLTFDGRTAEFVKFGAPVPNATFVFHVTFSPEAGAADDPFAYPRTRFTFDVAPTSVFELKGCKGTPQFDSAGNFIGISDILTAGLDLVPAVTGVQYSCAFEELVRVTGPNTIQVTQGIYLIGDWRSFR
jgi:hypothetical protein